MSDPIDTAYDRAQAAIKALADAGHRAAHEHAFAVDQLRQEVESLRAINAGLRHKCEAQEVGLVNLRRSDQDLRLERAALRERLADLEHRCAHGAEVLAMPVDTEAPREVVLARGHGWMHEVGAKPSDDSYDKRSAIIHDTGWVAYAPHGWKPRRTGLTEAQARIWVLDGVLP